jgi:uncharacterized membrane protein YfcA
VSSASIDAAAIAAVMTSCGSAGVVAGIVLGWQILKRMPQDAFESVLAWLTAFAAIWLIVG